MLSSCQVGAGMLAASVAVSMLNTQGKKQFVASLDPAQQDVFRRVCRQRLLIYVVSLAVGAGAGWLAVGGMGAEPGWRGVCAGAGVATAVSYFAYRLWPKELWMLDYLATPQQTRLWLRMYRAMCLNFHAGFLLGLAGYGVFLRGRCCCPSGQGP